MTGSEKETTWLRKKELRKNMLVVNSSGGGHLSYLLSLGCLYLIFIQLSAILGRAFTEWEILEEEIFLWAWITTAGS
jgi:hypothetical protein